MKLLCCAVEVLASPLNTSGSNYAISRLFWAVLVDLGHVLQHLLPPAKPTFYCPRALTAQSISHFEETLKKR